MGHTGHLAGQGQALGDSVRDTASCDFRTQRRAIFGVWDTTTSRNTATNRRLSRPFDVVSRAVPTPRATGVASIMRGAGGLEDLGLADANSAKTSKVAGLVASSTVRACARFLSLSPSLYASPSFALSIGVATKARSTPVQRRYTAPTLLLSTTARAEPVLGTRATLLSLRRLSQERLALLTLGPPARSDGSTQI